MDSDENKPRVLISAYACEPDRGSEPEVGWQVALHMACVSDVSVITRSNNREVIESALEAHDGPKPKFHYYDLPRPLLWLKKRLLGTSGYYVMWQAALRWRFRRELEKTDLVHHVTFNGLQFPGFWLFAGKPVVLGPLGGGMTCPPQLMSLLGGAERGERHRSWVIDCLPFFPFWRRIIGEAATVIAANRETASVIQPFRREQVPVMLETAVLPEAIRTRDKDRRAGKKLRVVWLGNLIPRKAPILALAAAAEVLKNEDGFELVIAGGGPEESRLRREIERLGLEGQVTLAGKIPKSEVNTLMDSADAFLFTSVRDTSGNVVLEAMSRGLPVVALCHQGVREICEPESALLVEPGNTEETVLGLAEAMIRLSREEGLAQRLGRAGQKHLAANHTWNHYQDRMMEVYREAIES
ncbi:glycosyltransferase family 4 protein [Haloferula sp.]|uniref:glycosyltransferase family 4 protein n=1 Tax=Haloferula sp. TaxID=2497595 RepID=UPI00329B2CA2